MQVWIDAQLPPSLADALRREFAVDANHVVTLGFGGAKDRAIFAAARLVDAIVVTKDSDFVRLLEAHGPPPRILWITLGNSRNSELWESIRRNWARAMMHFDSGEPLVEIARIS